MKKYFLFMWLLITLLAGRVSIAQQPEEDLVRWAMRHPIEKIYLHFDREEYAAGETAWFKAYLSSEYLPDTISTSLQVEFSGEGLKEPQRLILPVLLGTSAGQWEIPDTLQTGMYTVYAFTPSMLKQSPDFLFKKSLWIHGRERKTNTTVKEPELQILFFPEGGNLVEGLSNSIAFKAVYDNGLPAKTRGKIYNQKGEELATLQEEHDGMGVFGLNPVAGEKYTAVITEPVTRRVELPGAVKKGVVMSVIPHPRGNFFEIRHSAGDPVFEPAWMIGQMQHRVVFRHDFPAGKNAYEGLIDTRHLHSGILQLTVFNRQGLPLAERLCFVNNQEYLQPVILEEDTVSFSPRGRNRFRLSFTDTVQGNISISVTDADFEPTGSGDENIFSTFLLTSDLTGYVHRPAYYLSDVSDSVRSAADLLMMTHGWRRFKWTAIPRPADTATGDNVFIQLNGKVTLRGTSKPFADKALLMMINDVGGRIRSTQMLQTRTDGSFMIDSLIFFDKKLLLFSDVKGKKSQYIDVQLREYALQRGIVWPRTQYMPDRITRADSKLKSWKAIYEEFTRAKGLMLDEVTINVKKKSPLQELDDRYTKGMFSGEATRTIDLVNTEEALPYNNIFDYLQSRVNGLTIVQDGPDYGLFYRQGPTISSMGNIPMTLFLNEIETDVSVIASIPANQVALVKLYSTFAGAWGNAPGGVLSIYTRKGKDFLGNAGRANTVYYEGYSVVKEFFSPDYATPQSADKPDNRLTLDWRPAVFINNFNPRIPFSFYNNDRTRSFRIVVAGMTAAGKLIWMEKKLSAK